MLTIQTNTTRRRYLQILATMGMSSACAPAVWAQANWPARPIKIVIPAPAGGAVDVFVRLLGESLATALGQPVIADNRPGAGGLIGTKLVSASAPDGYTLGYLHSGLITAQAMNPQLNILKEFRPIARLTASPFLVVVRADSPYKTFKELLAAVQANPDKLSYGSGGNGSPAHLAVEQLNNKLGGNFKALHVPFKGATETATAIIGGQIDFSISIFGTVAPLVASGKLKALAVTSGIRLPMLPQVPTLSESGFPSFTIEPWGGLVAPANTPDTVIRKLIEVLPKILEASSMKDLIGKMGSYASYAGIGAFTTQIEQELEVEKALIKRLNLTAAQ